MTRQFTVTLVRHGETSMNAKRLLQGHTDTPLSEVGVAQGIKLGKYLVNHEKFTSAYASTLQRSYKTAHLVLQYSGNTVEAIIDKRLCERGFGEAEGKGVAEVHEEARKKGIAFHSYTPEGAEAFSDVQDRVKGFFEDLCKLADEENDDSNVLIVTHGGLIVAMMRFLLSNNNKTYTLKNFDQSSSLRIPRNTGISKFTIGTSTNGSNQRVIEFITLNDTKHLDL